MVLFQITGRLEMYLLKSGRRRCRVKNERVVGGKKNLGGKWKNVLRGVGSRRGGKGKREMPKKANNLVERSLGETWCCKKCWEMWRGYTIHDIKIKFLPTFYQTNFSSTTWNIFFPFVIASKRYVHSLKLSNNKRIKYSTRIQWQE